MHNSVIVGRVGGDPKPVGQNGCRFSIATDRYNSSTQQRDTTWSNMVAFGKTAEFIQKHVTKGQLVACEAEYQTREWDDNGTKKVDHSFFVKSIDPFLERDPNRQPKADAKPDAKSDGNLW